VTSGFTESSEKFSSTQKSLRDCSSSDGVVARKVMVTSSSDLMTISILTSSVPDPSVAALAGDATVGSREIVRLRMPVRPTARLFLEER